jgi:hypothetical protein
MNQHKDNIRFTFDCPVGLHTVAKMKASAQKQSMKDYVIGLMAKDIAENPVNFLADKSFKKELKKILHDDAELMEKLSKR